MLQLPNNCRAGKISVYPPNWKTVRANPSSIWYIHYRFYDDNLHQSIKVIIKGLNHLTTVTEKRDAVKVMIDDEVDLILNQGYNRITKSFPAIVDEGDITENTGFSAAMNYAYTKAKVNQHTLEDIKSTLKYIYKAADSLKFSNFPIGKIRRRHIVLLLEKCGELKPKEKVIVSAKSGKTKNGIWSANTFNKYRSNLAVLYKVLMRLDVVDANYPLLVEKETSIRRIRDTLTPEQMDQVNRLLFQKNKYYWRLLHIFFHSSSREVEVLRLKRTDVDLINQRFKVLVKKGRGNHKEEWRTIKTVVLPLWEEVISEVKAGEFLFHRGLRPGGAGGKPIRAEQISKRWLRHVKKPLGITADFYSLKHSNLDAVSMQLGQKAASKAAGHSSVVVTMQHYLINEKQREHEALKDVNNRFGS